MCLLAGRGSGAGAMVAAAHPLGTAGRPAGELGRGRLSRRKARAVVSADGVPSCRLATRNKIRNAVF